MKKSHLFAFPVEIYRSRVYLTVAETMIEALDRLPDDFDKARAIENHPDAAALMLPDGEGGFAICFRYDELNLDTMVHELFHLTHEILNRVNANFDLQHDEQGALLIGWLTAKVTKQLRKWKVKL